MFINFVHSPLWGYLRIFKLLFINCYCSWFRDRYHHLKYMDSVEWFRHVVIHQNEVLMEVTGCEYHVKLTLRVISQWDEKRRGVKRPDVQNILTIHTREIPLTEQPNIIVLRVLSPLASCLSVWGLSLASALLVRRPGTSSAWRTVSPRHSPAGDRPWRRSSPSPSLAPGLTRSNLLSVHFCTCTLCDVTWVLSRFTLMTSSLTFLTSQIHNWSELGSSSRRDWDQDPLWHSISVASLPRLQTLRRFCGWRDSSGLATRW